MNTNKLSKNKFTKEERSWITYEWADSTFTSIMMASIFPIFFVNMAGGEGSFGSAWWGYGNSFARLISGILAPLIGSLLAFKGYKKRFLLLFVYSGVFVHLLIVFQNTWQTLLISYIITKIFWSLSSLVYDSYLPDATTKERMGKVAAWGKAMGYLGGSTIPFAIAIILVLFGENFGINEVLAVRISIAMSAIWWGIFAIPIFINVHFKFGINRPPKGVFKSAILNSISTAKKIKKNKGLFIFVLAYFFYIDGVGTIVTMATAFGAEIGLSMETMIGALFATQIIATIFSIIFGKLESKYNSISLIIFAIYIYILICIIGFIMSLGLEENWISLDTVNIMFWVLAGLVGTVQGGIQAMSIATFGRLIPVEHSGEYFGFFEIFGRFAAILGPFLYASILTITGRPSVSMLSIIGIFITGLILLMYGKKHM